MRFLLRLVAVFTLLSVLGTLILVASFWHRGTVPALIQSGALGIITIAGWLLTLIAGIPAAIFLWRPTDAGRIAAAITWGGIGLYYVISIVAFHGPGANYTLASVYIAVCVGVVTLVLSPQAQRASRAKRSSTEAGNANI